MRENFSLSGFQGFDPTFLVGYSLLMLMVLPSSGAFWAPKDSLNSSTNMYKFLPINTSSRLCILGERE